MGKADPHQTYFTFLIALLVYLFAAGPSAEKLRVALLARMEMKALLVQAVQLLETAAAIEKR